MIQLWVRAIKKHRIVRSETVPYEGDLLTSLGELCTLLDISRPLFLGKHEREWTQFGMTSFTRDHFVESIPFDKIEIEQIDPDAKKKKSQDPRNG